MSVDMLKREITLSPDELAKLKTFHRFLFSNVLRLEKDPMDYQQNDSSSGYLVVPLQVRGKEYYFLSFPFLF